VGVRADIQETKILHSKDTDVTIYLWACLITRAERYL
jgi:hypothetical protein